MATRNAQTQAKRARELVLREKRERKREKKEARRAGVDNPDGLVEVAEDRMPLPSGRTGGSGRVT